MVHIHGMAQPEGIRQEPGRHQLRQQQQRSEEPQRGQQNDGLGKRFDGRMWKDVKNMSKGEIGWERKHLR